MDTFQYNDWHLWDSMNPFNPGFLLSDESKKDLTHHKTLDDAINYLYHIDKGAAKALNKFKKGKQRGDYTRCFGGGGT